MKLAKFRQQTLSTIEKFKSKNARDFFELQVQGICSKRKLHYDNARPRVASSVQQYLSKCNIKIMPHALTVQISNPATSGCF